MVKIDQAKVKPTRTSRTPSQLRKIAAARAIGNIISALLAQVVFEVVWLIISDGYYSSAWFSATIRVIRRKENLFRR